MSIRVLGLAGDVLGVLELPSSILISDLEVLRRLGAHRIEVVTVKISAFSD